MKKFQKKILKNGMTILHEYRGLPVISLSITNRFGASYEESEIKGIAHLIEHLVFTGTRTRTHEDISREIEKKGGVLNAFTSQDTTSFWFKLPSEHLFRGLEILKDIINNPIFEEKKFEKEKRVILEEIKMYHDIPQRHVFEMIEANLYKKPFGESIAGSEKTVKSMKRDFVFDYFKNVYNPKEYIITLVGEADFEKVCDYIEKNFAPNNKVYSAKKIELQNKETIEKRKDIDQSHFVFAFHAPKQTEKDYFALEVLDAYLANGMSSRLFLEIREKRGLAYAIQSSFNTEKNYSYYSLYVGTTKEALSEVKKLILEEFEKAENLTEKQLKESKEQIIGQRKIHLEESSNVMNELMFSELIDKAENYYKHEEKISSVTLADVKKLAKIKSFSTATIMPE
ncbi:insulinase family protein [Candidatus Pacearchaeota archaeon]|nr:insulinase family protein [Candidatus Pacearchaeota archaeon]